MAEDKKNEDEKTSQKPKASAGAWWKSTVVEDEQHVSDKRAGASSAKDSEKSAESVEKKPARKRSPRKTAAKNNETSSPNVDDGAVAATKTPRKRAPRKKKEEPVESAEMKVSEPKSSDINATVVAEVNGAAAPPKRQPRKRPARKKKTTENTAAEQTSAEVVTSSAVVTDTGNIQAEPAVDIVQEKEATPRKRAPRKRSPRKKKPAVASDAASEKSLEAVEVPGSPKEVPAGAAESVVAAQSVEEQAEPVKRAPRKRSPRKRKKTVPSTHSDTALTGQEVVKPVEPAGQDSMQGNDSTAATVEGQEEAGQETPKRRPSNRRSRGRRKSGARQAEAPTVVEPEPIDDLDDDDIYDFEDDDDFDDDDEFEDRRGRDRRDSYRSGVNGQEGSDEVPDLPDDEVDDEKSNLVLKLLINAEEPEECRLALLENGRLESIHVSTINRAQTKNNIYKARIVAIEPNLQAAFVDYGTEKNGFLPFSEIHPEYYKENLSPDIQKLVESHHWKKLSIIDVVDKGQDVMVQVVKEEVGKKGANMTTYLSLPGRSVVLMPGSDSSGISRKISGEERRTQLRNAMNGLGIPEGIGWIVRTAGVDITKSALARDVGYLLRLWEEIKKKAQDMDGVGQVYEDHQSVLRFLREHFDPAIEEILVDDEGAMEQVKEFVSLLPSKQRDVKVRLHKGSRPIFNQYSIEDQIESIYQPRVSLPSGGSIVIDPTEALVAIDVNSGSTSKGKNFDQSIYQANMEAASELARQLRLRDLGGLIVVDFIDMRNKKHIRDVERMVKVSMKRDKAKVDLSRISKFGLMQISRQKLGSPIEAGNYRVCQHCKGRGIVRSVETLALFYLRRIQTGASRKHVGRVECHFPLDVAQYLLNNKRHEILEHETRYDTEIMIIANPGMSPAEHEITLHKAEKEPIEKKQG